MKKSDQAWGGTAIWNDRTDMLRFLLTKGLDPNHNQGKLLNYACSRENLEAATLLFDAGLSPVLHHAENPLDIAVHKKNLPLVRLLVSKGVDVNYHKREALHRAARNHYVEILHFMFPYATIPDGEMILYLYWAVAHRDVSLTKEILDLGIVDEKSILTDPLFTRNILDSLEDGRYGGGTYDSGTPEMVNLLLYYFPGLNSLFKIDGVLL